MQQHTGQHLLTAVAQDRFGWPTTAFHLGARVVRRRARRPGARAADSRALEEAVAAEIRAARPVTARRVAPEERGARASAPAACPRDTRATCASSRSRASTSTPAAGRTSRSTAEIEVLKLLGTEPMRGGTRLLLRRGRPRPGRGSARTRSGTPRSRALLGAPEGLVEAVESAPASLDALPEVPLRRAEEEVADARGRGARRRSRSPVTEAHFDGRDMAFLGTLARRLATLAPAKLAFLTATNEAGSYFVLTGGEQVTADVQALGRQVAESLGGRGGGSSRLFQGKAATLAARGAAARCPAPDEPTESTVDS